MTPTSKRRPRVTNVKTTSGTHPGAQCPDLDLLAHATPSNPAHPDPRDPPSKFCAQSVDVFVCSTLSITWYEPDFGSLRLARRGNQSRDVPAGAERTRVRTRRQGEAPSRSRCSAAMFLTLYTVSCVAGCHGLYVESDQVIRCLPRCSARATCHGSRCFNYLFVHSLLPSVSKRTFVPCSHSRPSCEKQS